MDGLVNWSNGKVKRKINDGKEKVILNINDLNEYNEILDDIFSKIDNVFERYHADDILHLRDEKSKRILNHYTLKELIAAY